MVKQDIPAMLTKMCQETLSATDIRIICKNRGFPSKDTSRSVFENYFLSDIGVPEVVASLTVEETILLHFMKVENKEVDLRQFEAIYGGKLVARHWRLTFSQRYTPIFKNVQQSLLRKGLVIMAETGVGDSKMERLRLRFPNEFAKHLPAILQATTAFEVEGNVIQTSLRNKLMELVRRNNHGTSFEPGEFDVNLVGGQMHLGTQKLTMQALLGWQQRHWNDAVWAAHSKLSEQLSKQEYYAHFAVRDAAGAEKRRFPVILNYAFSQLSNNQWILPEELSPLLKVFYYGTTPPDSKAVCEVGWQQGCMAKHTENANTYYRLISPQNEEELEPTNYLTVVDNSFLKINLRAIPCEKLIHIGRFSELRVVASQLLALPDSIRMGRAEDALWIHPLTLWIKQHSSAFGKMMEMINARRGKHIIHENLLLARIKNLSLQVQIQKSFSDSARIVLLPNDFIAFPPDLLKDISKLVIKSGFVIKTISAHD